jgi:glycerate 2-kinase
MNETLDRVTSIKKIWEAAISAVSGREAVSNEIANDNDDFRPDLILAVGKAAVGMTQGALDQYPDCEALVVTKYHHADADILARENVEVIESAHPVPDQHSLFAGQRLLEKTISMSDHSRLLFLVSGGASALAEALPADFSLEDLQAMTDKMLSAGNTIAEINGQRKQTSLIKDGKLLQAFKGAEIRVYAISDVEGDSIGTIGSGLGDCHRTTVSANSTIVASNQIARSQAVRQAQDLGLEVKLDSESLYGDVFELAPIIGKYLQQASPGVYIWGGEPTIVLPSNPGRGGRNQSLALALSEYLSGNESISALVAGTDGTDGPTEAAGGLIDASTWGKAIDAAAALLAADAGTYLEKQQGLFVTGPTNTNVMDLVIAIVD